ncbi:MAG: pseudouridine synthase [Treponema sp.]
MSLARLDKILSHEGFGTRKGIKRLLRLCDVRINGVRVVDSGAPVNPDTDEISVDGKIVTPAKNIYIMMNKAGGAVSANKDGLHRTVFDFLDEKYRTAHLQEKLHIVGRLDIDTEGLLLFTTDGKLTHKITSPKSHFPKSYFVRLENVENGARQEKITRMFFDGIRIAADDNDAQADCKSALLKWHSADTCVLTITEGRYHQVKRMFKAAGNKVEYLKRISIGALHLDNTLEPGEYRELTAEEIRSLFDF